MGIDTSFSLSSSSSFSPSSFLGSSGLRADAKPSFPYTPSSLGRQWKGSYQETSRFFCESITSGGSGDPHHFLDACFLCKKPIAANNNIFLYKGNQPFCSHECREEQIEMDEALENDRKIFFCSSSSSSVSNSSSSASMIKLKPSLIIRQNSRNVHAVIASY